LSSVRLEILDFDLHRIDVRLRMPFRYGIATMTDGPVLFLRVRVRFGREENVGISSDLLPPKWFTKIPDKPIAEEIEEMVRVIQRAGQSSVGLCGESPFAIWQQLYEAQSDWAKAEGLPPLLANFGVSLVERALIEAVARNSGQTFAQRLRQNSLGIDLGAVHSSLQGLQPSALLPATPLASITVRHTVGLADPLDENEFPAAGRLGDGLPQSLASSIRRYGLRHFKIKVTGDVSRDLERLTRIAAVIGAEASPDFAFSLDGNEQFRSLEQFRSFWNEIQAQPLLGEFFKHLLFVEQPLHRAEALRPELEKPLAPWANRPPMIIDESDASLEDLPTALGLVMPAAATKLQRHFQSIANCCLLLARQREDPGRPFLMSGEDLCNIGPVALLQDFAVMAALGIQSVERNGHHYHAGLSQFPRLVQEQILRHHGDLYEHSAAGWPTLRIDHGRIGLGSINRAPFGVGFVLAMEGFARVN
jgi:hypothetical protein